MFKNLKGKYSNFTEEKVADTEWFRLASPVRRHIEIWHDPLKTAQYHWCDIIAKNVWLKWNYETTLDKPKLRCILQNNC